MKNITTILTILLIVLTISKHNSVARSNNYYDIVKLGAVTNSKSDSSKALEAAWNMACNSSRPSTINVPEGRFLIFKPIIFSGVGCKSNDITFSIKGTIVAPRDFQVLGDSKTWVSFEKVDGVTITGGVFDGQGASLWRCKRSGNGGCPNGMSTLRFSNSMNVVVDGVSLKDSELYHMVFNGCKKVKLEGVVISAAGDSPNTDGIHVQRSTGVTILKSNISTGDDCISIGDGTINMWIQQITCGPGHGISIGSLAKESHEAGVQNVTVETSTFTNTENGVRIKSWKRSFGGFVKNVLFQHITMVNVKNPIIIDQKYCPHQKNCPTQESGVRVSDVTYKDIHGSSATENAVTFNCSSKNHCTRLKLEDVYLTYNGKPANSTCSNSKPSTNGFVLSKSCL